MPNIRRSSVYRDGEINTSTASFWPGHSQCPRSGSSPRLGTGCRGLSEIKQIEAFVRRVFYPLPECNNRGLGPRRTTSHRFGSTVLHNPASGWLVGFLFVYFLHSIRARSFKLSRPAVWTGWTTTLAFFFTVILAMYPYGIGKSKSLSAVAETFYISLSVCRDTGDWPTPFWLLYCGNHSPSCRLTSTFGIFSYRTSMRDVLG